MLIIWTNYFSLPNPPTHPPPRIATTIVIKVVWMKSIFQTCYGRFLYSWVYFTGASRWILSPLWDFEHYFHHWSSATKPNPVPLTTIIGEALNFLLPGFCTLIEFRDYILQIGLLILDFILFSYTHILLAENKSFQNILVAVVPLPNY